jgi:hypothetical protein
MAIENWSGEKVVTLFWTIIIFTIITSILILITYRWYTSLEEKKIFADHNYTECIVYIPNTATSHRVWQKECQIIKLYPGVVIRK